MHNIFVKTKIFRPDMEAELEVNQFDSIVEAVRLLGSEVCLEVINKSRVTIARNRWRSETINKLVKEFHDV